MIAVKHSPKVAQILAKGEDITTSEIKYLFSRDVDVKDIAAHTGLEKSEILETRRNIKKPTRKKRQIKPVSTKDKFKLTLEKYQEMRADKITKKKICQIHGIDTHQLRAWEIANGLVKANVRGLTLEKYEDYRHEGLWDNDIAKKYRISISTLSGWRDLHFTKEELKEMWKK